MNTVEFIRMQGREEGLAEVRAEFQISVVRKLLATTDFSNEKIASIVEVTPAFVNEIRQAPPSL